MYTTPLKEEINICGTEITVEINTAKCEGMEASGYYHEHTIYLKSSYPSYEIYRDTYVHECFHALCEILGIQLDIHTEEILANRIGYMIANEI